MLLLILKNLKKKRKTKFCFYAPSIAPEVEEEWWWRFFIKKYIQKTNPQDNFIVIKCGRWSCEKVKKYECCEKEDLVLLSFFSGYICWNIREMMILKKSLFILIDRLMSFAKVEMLCSITQVIVLMKSWPSSPMKMTGTNWSMTLSSRTS